MGTLSIIVAILFIPCVKFLPETSGYENGLLENIQMVFEMSLTTEELIPTLDREVMLEFIKNNEDVLTRNNRIAHFTAFAWITNHDRNKILMIHHNIYNSWAWVGGHADGDDDFLYVAKKEIGEETGITNLKLLYDGIYGINIVTVDNHIRKGQFVNSHLHFDVEYLFEADENEEVTTEDAAGEENE